MEAGCCSYLCGRALLFRPVFDAMFAQMLHGDVSNLLFSVHIVNEHFTSDTRPDITNVSKITGVFKLFDVVKNDFRLLVDSFAPCLNCVTVLHC